MNSEAEVDRYLFEYFRSMLIQEECFERLTDTIPDSREDMKEAVTLLRDYLHPDKLFSSEKIEKMRAENPELLREVMNLTADYLSEITRAGIDDK